MNSHWGTRVPELDGIRAIAIWMVLLLHILVFENHPVLLFLPRVVREIIGHGWLRRRFVLPLIRISDHRDSVGH